MAYLFWAIDLSGTAQASQGLTVARCAPWRASSFRCRQSHGSPTAPRSRRGSGSGPSSSSAWAQAAPFTGAGRRLKAHAPGLKIVSIVPEILPGIEGLTPLGCPEDIVPAILGVAGRIVARAAYDALVLRGTIGHGLRLLVDDALRGGVHARRPRPELEPEARRVRASDRGRRPSI